MLPVANLSSIGVWTSNATVTFLLSSSWAHARDSGAGSAFPLFSVWSWDFSQLIPSHFFSGMVSVGYLPHVTSSLNTYVCVHAQSLQSVWLLATLWTVALHAPLSMGFSRKEYWSWLPHPSPGDLPNPEIKPVFLTSPALAGGFFTTNATWEAHYLLHFSINLKCSFKRKVLLKIY